MISDAMVKALIAKAKLGAGRLIEKQLDAASRARIGGQVLARISPAASALGRIAPGLDPHPPLRLAGTEAERDTGGGHPRAISLPLCVTPCSLFRAATMGRG